MEELIRISNLNDFLFCPVSIYFHGLMDGADRTLIQSGYQIDGTAAHRTIDSSSYSSRKDMLQGIDVYSERYGLIGKIDTFDVPRGILTERKKHITSVYPGHIFQMYGQYFGLLEMGYTVRKMIIHSLDDNRNYDIPHPDSSPELIVEFESLIDNMHEFAIDGFRQENKNKCRLCIYAPMCANGEFDDDEDRS